MSKLLALVVVLFISLQPALAKKKCVHLCDDTPPIYYEIHEEIEMKFFYFKPPFKVRHPKIAQGIQEAVGPFAFVIRFAGIGLQLTADFMEGNYDQ